MGSRGGGGRRRRGYGPTGFEEAGGYMAAKIAKLENQYEDSVTIEGEEEKRGLFSGVAIFVNGYTEPTAMELKRLMMVHGGTYHHYYSHSKTTHIIANNLPDAKVKHMNTERIVSPKWITDSLNAGRLLNYRQYILYSRQSRSQPQLPFKVIASPKKSGGESLGTLKHEAIEQREAVRTLKHELEEHKESIETMKHVTEEQNAAEEQEQSIGTVKQEAEEQRESIGVKQEVEELRESIGPVKHEGEEPDLESWEEDISCVFNYDLDELDGNTTQSDPKDSKVGAEGEGNHNKPNASTLSTPSTSTLHKSPLKGHAMSTANPRFLTEFYNNSRLHHISTMGAMFKAYVNELQNKCDGFPGREKLKSWLQNRNAFKSEANHSEDLPQASGFHPKSKRIIMHIDMDCFFVSVGLRKHPELRGKPVAVTHARGNPQGQAREGMDRQYELNFYKERAEKKLKAKMQATGSKVTDTLKNDVKKEVDDADDAEHNDRSLDKKFSTIQLIDETSSMSEIASCNYEARKAGVKNGMYVGPALKLCPGLQMIPYDFDGYKEVSYKLYDIVASFTHDIEAVSCDEMFVDLTELLQSCQVSPLDFTTYLRERVQAETGCPCSAGLGPNMLVTRMATRLAKPNGQHWADPQNLALYMKDHKVTELPGVGWSTGRQLEAEGLVTCEDLQQCSLGHLQTLFGPRTGQSLYNYCRGVDTRPVRSEHVRKSVSAEVNYGIRFTCHDDAYKFIRELAAEVESRLAAIKMKGKCITLKLKIRAKDAPIETAKYMGHGVCDNIAKSASLNCATSSADVIERETLVLLKQIKSSPQDFRGVGIQVSRLEAACATKTLGTSIKSFLLRGKHKTSETETSSTGTTATNTPPAAIASNLSRDKTTEVTLVESAEKSPDITMKNFLLRGKRKASEVGNAHSLTKNMDVHSHHKSSMSKTEAAIAGAKSSSEQKPVLQGHNTDQSLGTGQLLHITNTPIITTNDNSSKAKSIDMEVLMALPEDMRDQVIAEYQQQGYIIPSLTNDRDSDSSHRHCASEAQPGTSGLLVPEQSRKQVTTTTTIKSETTVNGPQTNLSETVQSEISQVRGHEVHREVATNKKNAPTSVFGENRSIEDIGEASNSNSNFSMVSENAQDSPLISSFSQVDSSFLDALPEELREELRQDLEHLKQVREAPPLPPQPRVKSGGSLVKSGNIQGRGRGGHRGVPGRRGRRSKMDQGRVEAEGLVTLTSMILSNTEQQNMRAKKDTNGDKNGGQSAEFQNPVSDTSLSKEKPKMSNNPDLSPNVANELLASDQEKEAQRIKAEVVPDLCGMRELGDVKSVIQAWVASCACPENEDAEILGGYFTSLITHHDLEKLDCLIKYLYRQILRTRNKLWESAYQVIINQVQSAMLELHGAKLKVKLFPSS